MRNQIGLTWTDNSYNETGFRIMCSTNDGIDFTLIDSVPANATEFNHTELIPGTEYIYYVYAYNAAGDSEPSNTVSVTLLVAPAAPTGLVGKAVSNQIELTWTDNSYNETGFLIQCSTNDGNTFAEIGTTPANDPAFNHTKNITPGAEYIYRVYAFNDAGNSEPSNTVSVTAFTLY